MSEQTPLQQHPDPIKKKKDDKHRRRDPRSWENIKKTTLAMSEEERNEYFAKMYIEVYNENRLLFSTLQHREKQVQTLQKESDRDRSELTKSILARGQLESLCRELQKQNKLIKEENVARIKEEEDRRREVANTFTERLNALTNLITESKDKSNKVKEENQNMTEKLTELYEQYQQRENHLETVTKQLDLQKKLAETQAKKAEIEREADRQIFLADKKALVMKLEQYEKEIVLLQEKNRSLEAQVDLYKSQYSDFETTMTKSNKVFDIFKEEMSRMNKQLHVLESERNDLRKRWQSSVNSLIVLSEQHVALSNEQSALEKRLAMLQKLCRQLQEDRSAFLKQLKEHNIEPVVPTLKNEISDKDAVEQNAETSKSKQRALKLKQELGKVKEVAALISLDRDPPSDENDATDDLSSVMDQGLESIQQHIEQVDINIEEMLESEPADIVPKRFKSLSEGQSGEGDMPPPGPSHKDGEQPSTSSAAGTQTSSDIQEAGTQTSKSTAEASTQPDDIIMEPVPVHRVPAAHNLMRERPPSHVSIGGGSVMNLGENFDNILLNGGTSTSSSTVDTFIIQETPSEQSIGSIASVPPSDESNGGNNASVSNTSSSSSTNTSSPRFMEEEVEEPGGLENPGCEEE